MTTIRDVFEQSVKHYAEEEALVDVRLSRRWTFSEWDKEVNQLAQAFIRAGVKKGDRVSTVLFNTSEFAMTFLACAKLGAVFNPINFRLADKEIEFIINDAEPRIVLFEKAVENQIRPLADRIPNVQFWYIDEDPPSYADSYYERLSKEEAVRPDVSLTEDDIYAIMYTSGTTGKPKGVVHKHRDMVDQSVLIIASQRISTKDIGLSIAPLFHCAELHCAFIPRLQMGAKNVLLHHFDPEAVLNTVQKENISIFFAAPTMWSKLIQEKKESIKLDSLKKALYGGAPMAPALVKEVHGTFDVQLVQAYGMTEMGPAITILPDEAQLTKAGSAGKPLINHEIRVVRAGNDGQLDPNDEVAAGEQGEIIVRGPSMMSEYYKRPEATAEVLCDGWYFSGDVGYFDSDGYLWVNDRIKDMIVSGGENIYSREVEDALFDHPGVLDAAVVGEPDEKWGERVMAFVVKKEESVTAEELEKFCIESDRLANYKRPRRYEFVDELPRNASGKLQKFKLRERVKKQEGSSRV
ncbi:fatty acid--CoA ligase [Alteribacillus bidgolensis]|uniref:Fatty-acyl-CoA synthase n=1 Tax=Alteribacillus bidgolensis TaxID=930129 RepID=A0A1G8L6C2_9BACI|nr:fatty acid--CoA ligase [Alteribacillus bidgolensis]SDI51238.1 fatty-acyl-CoA synthase [Alteribacillus bidgolensis]